MKQEFRHGSVLKLTRYDTPETIEKDFANMKACGMDTVVIWPAAFYWEEKVEGYPFNTGRTLLKIAERYDLKIIMELAGQLTVMEYVPDSLMKPEYYAVDEYGHREWGQSSFGFLSYFHPEVNDLICKHYRAAAEAYREYPALLGYDIFNETMFRSHDEYTMREFREWLKEKYGTLEKLNEVWERTYSDWDQIDYQQWKWMSVMPEADFGMFRKASVGRFLAKWKRAITEVDDTHMIVADNIHSMVIPNSAYKRPQDDFDLKKVVGEIGMSFYPKQISGTRENANRWEIFDGFYAASQREGFYVAEMQTHIQALYNYNTCVRPYELKRWCYEAYAAGAKGLIYWMWRPFDKGLQTLGRGLVDYKGRPTERFDMAKQIGASFAANGTLTPCRSRVGILYDTLCDDLHRPLTNAYKLDKDIYLCSMYGAYKAMFDVDTRCDIVTLEEIGDYKAIIVTNEIVMDQTRAEALSAYVKNGGLLIVDGRFGVIAPDSQLCDELPGGALNELCGQEFMDSDYEGLDYRYGDLAMQGVFGRDLMRLTDGEAVGFFGDGFPAVVRRKHGAGEVLFFNTQLWYGYYRNATEDVRALARKLVEEYDLGQVTVDGNLKVRVAEGNGKLVFFLFNYGDKEETATVTLRVGDRAESFTATVAANDSVMIERAK